MTNRPTEPIKGSEPQDLPCGCRLVFDLDPERDRDTLAWLTPCSDRHRLVALLSRKPGSLIVVCQVPA